MAQPKAYPAKRGENETKSLDFNAASRVRKIVQARPRVMGISIDPRGTYIIDDGVWITRRSNGWRLETSIADLPAILPPGNKLEGIARDLLDEQGSSGKRQRIWPVNFLSDHVSLREGRDQPSITFTIDLDEKMNVERYDVQPTIFRNMGEHPDRSFAEYRDFSAEQIRDWRIFALKLYQKRCRDLGYAYDSIINPADAVRGNDAISRDNGDMRDGKLLIHEAMRLTNVVATEYFKTRNLTVPFKAMKASVTSIAVTDDFNFDMVCNRLCADLVSRIKNEASPVVHLNSPMRTYRSYVTMKVLGRDLAGLPEDPSVREEINSLSEVFNRKAAEANRFLLSPGWRNEWRQVLRIQGNWHAFKAISSSQERPAATLKQLCAGQGWPFPHIAERRIRIQGADLYFVGMNVQRSYARDVQAWALSANVHEALNAASRRALNQMPEGQALEI